MKRLISFLLCSVLLVCTLSSCMDKLDAGTELNLYMEMPTNFDPATAYNDQAAAQFLPLIYQGLFTIDKKGKLRNAMCDEYTVNGNVIEFTLNDTCWSDGTSVLATDFVYAWERILDPEFQSEAASLLFYIQNAVEVKNGDMTIDNLRLYASGDKIIRVELIDSSYVDDFLKNCASIALYPLREDAISKLKLSQLYYDNRDKNGNVITDPSTQTPVLQNNSALTTYTWSTLSTILVSCGPFFVKRTDLQPESGPRSVVLERNKYFYRDTSELGDDALRKYVDPYRLNVEFITPEEAKEAYDAGTAMESFNDLPLVYNSNLPLESRSTGDNLKDLMATYTYFFNTANPMFENADVRRALSGVLDRNEIANIVVYGKPATGLINDLVLYGAGMDTFRSKAGNALGSVLSESEAKSLISGAGVTPGEITLTIRNNEAEKAVAEYVQGKWQSLGFTVNVETLSIQKINYVDVVGVKNGTEYDVQELYEGLTRDLYVEKYQSGEFDVIGVQYNMLSTDPFVALAPFAPRYSGNSYDFTSSSEEFELVKGVTGYDSEAYSTLIDQALNAADADGRSAVLVDAEKQLLNDAVVAPLYFMQSGSVMKSNLTGLSYRYDGIADFTEATDENYTYVPEAFLLPASKIWG